MDIPVPDATNPFAGFEPVCWTPSSLTDGGECAHVYSVKRNHGIQSAFHLHNPKDEINEKRQYFDKVLIEYRIGKNSYDLFTVSDFFSVPFAFDPRAGGNIMGDLAERIARRITKYWLKHFSENGRTGGIFDRRFDPRNRNEFIVAHTDRYVLKIDRYPNLVILKKTGRGKYGYENIKELDGLFDYRIDGSRHILVLESKIDKINVNCGDLVSSLFGPLKEIFPEARFSYVLFSDRESIFAKKYFSRQRRLKQFPLQIYETLKADGVGSLFFTFNETPSDFERMRNHLITQYRAIGSLGIVLHGKMVLSNREIILFDEGETPHIKLVRDHHSGLWREVKLTHKGNRGKETEPPRSGR